LTGAAVAAVTPVPAGAEQATFPPFALEDVDFESDCAPNAAFNRLLTLLFGLGSFPDNAAAYDEPLHKAVSGDAHHVLRRLHGTGSTWPRSAPISESSAARPTWRWSLPTIPTACAQCGTRAAGTCRRQARAG